MNHRYSAVTQAVWWTSQPAPSSPTLDLKVLHFVVCLSPSVKWKPGWLCWWVMQHINCLLLATCLTCNCFSEWLTYTWKMNDALISVIIYRWISLWLKVTVALSNLLIQSFWSPDHSEVFFFFFILQLLLIQFFPTARLIDESVRVDVKQGVNNIAWSEALFSLFEQWSRDVLSHLEILNGTLRLQIRQTHAKKWFYLIHIVDKMSIITKS